MSVCAPYRCVCTRCLQRASLSVWGSEYVALFYTLASTAQGLQGRQKSADVPDKRQKKVHLIREGRTVGLDTEGGKKLESNDQRSARDLQSFFKSRKMEEIHLFEWKSGYCSYLTARKSPVHSKLTVGECEWLPIRVASRHSPHMENMHFVNNNMESLLVTAADAELEPVHF